MADYNPLYSKLRNVLIGQLSIVERNEYCQFEKVEMVESVVNLFPQGSLIVRDTSDIMTYIQENLIETITFEFEEGRPETYFITNYSFINNGASSTEENFVSIQFTNYLFKLSQNTTVTELLQYEYPQVLNIDKFYKSELLPKINELILNPYNPCVLYSDNYKSSNFMVYRPINPLETKHDIVSENFIQYMYYISSMMCDSEKELPRFLFWTGFDNEVNLKYIPTKYIEDPNYQSNNEDRNYGVYESDVPSSKLSDGKVYKKIYQLITQPAKQYYNRNYYYTRVVPTILDEEGQDSPDQEINLFNHQYLDQGSRFKTQIVTGDGEVDILPESKGWASFETNRFYGYYETNDIDNNFRDSSLLSMSYGNSDTYLSKTLTGVDQPYPFIDSPEMWKNMFDLTPVHPNIGGSETTTGQNSNLQKVYRIRNVRKFDTTKLEQMKEIERQNFILYVLCCVKDIEDEQEETFFAAITGWVPDPTHVDTLGYNGEPLRYRYSWKKIQISINLSDLTLDFPYYTNPEMDRWERTGGSVEEDITTWAINLNERTNYVGSQNGYYAPGWYAKNLTETLFNYVTYRPIGNRTGDLQNTATFTSLPYRAYHIVKMTKIPFSKIIKDAVNYSSVITDATILNDFLTAAAGKYLYHFELANITDGKCNIETQP
jgi:hypothetical protein